jgi:hypothetical protein
MMDTEYLSRIQRPNVITLDQLSGPSRLNSALELHVLLANPYFDKKQDMHDKMTRPGRDGMFQTFPQAIAFTRMVRG